MQIAVIGAGFVGLTHSVVCAESGHRVLVFDIDGDKIAAYRSGRASRIESYVNEPGLSQCIRENLGKTLEFTTDAVDAVEDAEAIFLCVPTPSRRDGATDGSQYQRAAHQVARLLAQRCSSARSVVVNKSTVPVGTARAMEAILGEHKVRDVGVVSNPEFLPQGNALEAARHPDRVVVGADHREDLAILRRIYRRFARHVRIRYLETTPETAEAIKYVANSLLFTYISFWNGVGARLAETYPGLRLDDLKLGVTADSRISPWGSFVGVGAGGSCFGKDIRSLIHQLERHGRSAELLHAVYRINEYQKTYLIDRAAIEAGFDFNNKSVALLGLAFKKNTNDMRDSAALRAVESLLARGVRSIRAYDPLAAKQAQTRWFHPSRNQLFERISYCPTAREALVDSDAVYIATDLEEFRELGPVICDAVEPPYLVIDGRRILADREDLRRRGYDCLSVGESLIHNAPATASVTPICETLGIFVA